MTANYETGRHWLCRETVFIMNIGIKDDNIPGTRLHKHEMGNVTGMEFLNKIFFITDGIMLSQVREISNVDGSTLQNWVKRGWIMNPVNKRYSKDQLARILIINMLRDTMLFERIDFLLKYINGNVNNRDDDIICESELYEYICRILERITPDGSDIGYSEARLNDIIDEILEEYSERVAGAKKRLEKALEIIVISYYATLLKAHTNQLFENL